MFKYLMAFLALVAVTFAAPEARPSPVPAPKPNPQVLTYGAGIYGYPYAYSAPAVVAGVPAAYTYY